MNRIASSLLLASLLVGSTAFAEAAPTKTPAVAAVASLGVEHPWVRAVPPTSKTTAAYVTLQNKSAADVRVVGAASDAATTVELHNHINDGGVMKMRKVDFIDVKANSETHLAPGGLHIMLIDVKKPLKLGDVVTITLTLADKSTVTLQAPVSEQANPEQHAHGAQGSTVEAFHDVLSPLWHAPESDKRTADVCAAAASMRTLSQRMTTEAAPAGAKQGYAAATKALDTSVVALQQACTAKAGVPTSFAALHHAFHGVAETLH
jgi:copper(I)-binding protein